MKTVIKMEQVLLKDLVMNKEEIIKYCLTLENTYKDCHFPDDFESGTMRHW